MVAVELVVVVMVMVVSVEVLVRVPRYEVVVVEDVLEVDVREVLVVVRLIVVMWWWSCSLWSYWMCL